MSKFLKVLTNIFVLLGAVIGGGLSTGRELCAFFCQFGANFWIGNIICIISLVLILILITKYNFDFNNTFVEIAFFIVRLIIASTMISSLKSVCNYLPYSIVFYIVFLVLFFICMFLNIKKISVFFSLIVPVIVISLLAICAVSLSQNTGEIVTSSANALMVINPISYAAFNLFLLIYIVKSCLKTSTKKEATYSIVLFSILFFVLIFLMCFALLKSNSTQADIPMLNLVNGVNPILTIFFVIIIVLSILSTFIGVCLDLNETVREKFHIKNNFINNGLIFCFCLLFSNLGLDILINYGYKLVAYFSVLYFIIIFIKYLYQKKTTKTK